MFKETVIHFDRNKSILQIVLGVAILPCSLLLKNAFVFFGWVFGISLIIMGSKSLSKSVQFKFTSKGLFVGNKINKLIPIKSIEKIRIKSLKVDLQDEHFIEITSRIKSNSQQNKLIEDFPIENLTLSIGELSVIIDEYMEYKQNIGNEQKIT